MWDKSVYSACSPSITTVPSTIQLALEEFVWCCTSFMPQASTLSWSKKSKTFLRCHTPLWCDLCPCLIFNRLIKRVRAVSVECDLRNPECKLFSKSLLTHIDVQLMVNMLPTNQKSKGNCFTMSKNGITKKARLMQIMPKAPNNLGSNYFITKPDNKFINYQPIWELGHGFLVLLSKSYKEHKRHTLLHRL